MSKDDIQIELNQKYDTNIFRVAFMADSIWSPSGSSMPDTDGSHPPFRLNNSYFIRQLYDYLNFNKPTFRSVEHTDWTHTGGEEVNGFYPTGINTLDKIIVIDDDDNSIIQVTGKETVVFWFEGGRIGTNMSTGTALVHVSMDGINYVLPSETELLGMKQVGRINDELSYDTIVDELTTNIQHIYPVGEISDYKYISYKEIQYNGLNPEAIYYFRITKKSDTGPVRLGGCYYFTGKTCIFYNFSIPGAGSITLTNIVENTIGQNNINLCILQSVVYHDFYSESDIYSYYYDWIKQVKKFCTRIIMCSCTPGGVVVEDSSTSQGDEEAGYVKGQNFVKEFNHRILYGVDQPAWVDYPTRGAVYSISIGGETYNLTTILSRCSEVDFATWTYRGKLGLYYEEGVPVEDIILPSTLTKVSGSGAESFTLSTKYYFPPPMNEDRDIVKEVSNRMGIRFVDLYKLFADLAIANGETVETDAYTITEASPLYASYPDGMENYLSRFFAPNHWRDAANAPVYNYLKDQIFINFEFE